MKAIRDLWAKYKGNQLLREWVESFAVAAILAFCVIRPFIIQAFKIPTGSMRPTLIEGDLILVNKFLYGAKIPFTGFRLPAVRQPGRGDVIVFIFPEDTKKDFIKRLVGLPGDTIQINNGTILVNGKPIFEGNFSQRFYYNRGSLSRDEDKIVVPQDSFFVLGDNSANSADSRFWGFVPHKNILGKALVIFWPPDRIRIVK
jgi:signal peptidase I